MLTGGGAATGLIFGLGAVFLVAPGPNQFRFGRRWSDVLGRRASDQVERKVNVQNVQGERRTVSR